MFLYGKELDYYYKIPKKYGNKYDIVSEDFSFNAKSVNEYELSFEPQPSPPKQENDYFFNISVR